MTTSYQRVFPTAPANLPRPITRQITPDEVLELRGYIRGLFPSGQPVCRQVDFAKMWGRVKNTVYEWESGRRPVPSPLNERMVAMLDNYRDQLGTG